MKVSAARVVGSVVSVSLLTAVLLFAVSGNGGFPVSWPRPAWIDSVFSQAPVISLVLGGVLGAVLVLREVLLVLRSAWRVRRGHDVGAGPFRSTGASAWSARVPPRIVVVWLANGAASLVLVLGGRFPLPLVHELPLDFEQVLALAMVGEFFVLLAAGLMGAAGWMVVTRRDWHLAASRVTALFVCGLFVTYLVTTTIRLGVDVWCIVAWVSACLASAWLALEAQRFTKLRPREAAQPRPE